MARVCLKLNHGCRIVLKAHNGADSLSGVYNVFTNLKHASSIWCARKVLNGSILTHIAR